MSAGGDRVGAFLCVYRVCLPFGRGCGSGDDGSDGGGDV